MNLIIFGAPGAGKGTQSVKIAEKYNLAHISTGDVLRAEIQAKKELGEIASGYIDKGNLVPDSLIIDMLDKKLGTLENASGVIFDGFPRTVSQAEALDGLLEKRGQKVNLLVAIEVPEAELTKRLLLRGEASGRSDDNEETIKKRIQVYEEKTKPVMSYY